MNLNHIDRKVLKKEARELLKSNWKVLSSVLIIGYSLFFALLVIGDTTLEFLVVPLLLVLCIPLTVMYYKFFLKGLENKKFSFKDLKPNARTCFAMFKLIMFLSIIYIIFITLMGFCVSFFINNNGDFNINISSIFMYLLIYIVTCIFACIVNIIISIYFAFTYMYIVDKNIDGKIGVFKGIKNSYNLINGYRLKYIEIALSFIGYWIILIVPNVIFAIATKDLETGTNLFSGLIILIIWDSLGALFLCTYFMVCKTLLYKELKKRFENKEVI